MDPFEATNGHEPTPSISAFSERVRTEVAMICDLYDRGAEVDGHASLIGSASWVIYGRTTYDGEVILAEYDDAEVAAAVIRSLPAHVRGGRPDPA